ncbi:MAG: sulfite exporter TauE/SafE family protein [Thermoplasmatota archaeon]|nr:sulfite exporter TauE/SafE family protein [Halobacteriales archaeon]
MAWGAAYLERLAALGGIGLAAGYLSTLFGIGGGLVVVPLLVYGLGYGFETARDLSLLAMGVQTPFGLWTHHRRGAVDWRMGGWLAAGGIAGVLVGDRLRPLVPVTSLKLLFALIMVGAAWRLWVRLVQGEPRRIDWAALLLLGLGAGVVSRLLGIGGGLVTVPVLVLMGVSIHTAVATSLLPVFTNAAVASIGILREGATDWHPAPAIAVAALVAAPFGTLTAHAVPATPLKRAFAVVLVLAAAYVAATSGAFGGATP